MNEDVMEWWRDKRESLRTWLEENDLPQEESEEHLDNWLMAALERSQSMCNWRSAVSDAWHRLEDEKRWE